MADLREIVGAHEPHEARLRVTRLQCRERIGGEMRAKSGLEIKDPNAAIGADAPRAGDTCFQRRRALYRLQRILRRDQPPHLVEAEALQGFEADMAVARMRRVERAAEQADAALRQMAETGNGAQGRTLRAALGRCRARRI